MNIVAKSVAVVLAAAALGGLGAGVASASTPADTAAIHASVSSQVGARQNVSFGVTNNSNHYLLQLVGTSDPDNANGTWDGPAPTATTLQPNGDENTISLNVQGKVAAQGVLHFHIVDQNTGEQGNFDATVAWFDDGSTGGKSVVTVSTATPSAGSKAIGGQNFMELVNAG